MRILPAIVAVIFAGCGAPSEPSTSNAQTASNFTQASPAVPATSGLNEQLIEEMLEAAEGLPQLRSLIVMRDGEVLVEERSMAARLWTAA